ncbi:MAG TPA: UDP-2,3-diacylglucosamine hydrolase [Dysgonomonas sp.]|nr:UDP-2,3-diacylglucosamine hydrolase [Dysgonomonas sp.]
MTPEKKKIYFLSDSHLGSSSHKDNQSQSSHGSLTLPNKKNQSRKNNLPNHEIERKLCRWFDMAKADAKAIYLLGDIFDFWFEYKYVVPKGFTRVLGKIAELTDSGIEIHFFTGNHDMWVSDYLKDELGLIVHTGPLVQDIYGKKFFLAHGDGLGDESASFKILRSIFHNKLCQRLFASVHPRWSMAVAHGWSNSSRQRHGVIGYMGEEKEHLIQFAKDQLKLSPGINFFVFGHRHIMLDLMLSQSARIVILGDWITLFSYGVYDGENFFLEIFENAE